MIKFTKDSLIIEVYTGSNPIEFWLQLQHQLIHLNEQQSDSEETKCFQVNELLNSLIPYEAEEFQELCLQTLNLNKKTA